ncbi:MAG: hypothetical protein R3C05_19665 [Pirellulaceae bacterium]
MSTIPEQTHLQSNAEKERGSFSEGFGANTAPQYGSRGNHGEGPVARALEQQTARLPSDTWLWAAGGSIALSLLLQSQGDKQKALFVGNWAPTFLLLGIYNKLVKLHGSE